MSEWLVKMATYNSPPVQVLASSIGNRDLVNQRLPRTALRFIGPGVRMIVGWSGRVSVTRIMQMELCKTFLLSHY